MKKNYTYILLITILFFFIFYGVNALSVKQKGLILNNYKEKQYDLLFENDYGIINPEDSKIFNISKKINLFGDIKEGIKEDREKLEDKNNNNMSNIKSLEKSIEILAKEILNSTKSVNNINGKVINTKNEISSNKEIVKLLKNKVDKNKEILLKYLIYIYKKGNNAYKGEGIDNIKSILLNKGNISDLINDLYFKGLIEITGKKLIDKHKEYIQELYIKKLELEKQDVELRELRKQMVIERKVLSEKKKFKDKILTISKGKQALYEKYITNKIKVERSLQLRIIKEKLRFKNVKDKLLENYNCNFKSGKDGKLELDELSKDCINLNKVIYGESQIKGESKTTTGNYFSWPVVPYFGISSYFRDNSYKKMFGSNHDAIDIISNQSTLIKAPADGYIVHIQPADSYDYSFVAIKHSDGYLTVYGHVSEILVEEYDYVEKGQVFAKTGGKNGTVGVGVLSTGPHLHFEVYKNGNNVDPLDVLNLSYLKYNDLSEKYIYKYYNDFKERLGYDYLESSERGKIFKLNGSTEIERQKSLISQYAIGQFNNHEIWIEESLDGNIDPTFVMCIGLAETGLGRYLKTAYNIGNVGNTDSGSTYNFGNARSGIYAIIKTLNNKYLGSYNEIRELSRYGNKKGEIYASSPDYWHNNIIKCMSNIKGVYVPDNYNFRLLGY